MIHEQNENVAKRSKLQEEPNINSGNELKNGLEGLKRQIKNWLETDENKTQHAKTVLRQKAVLRS